MSQQYQQETCIKYFRSHQDLVDGLIQIRIYLLKVKIITSVHQVRLLIMER